MEPRPRDLVGAGILVLILVGLVALIFVLAVVNA